MTSNKSLSPANAKSDAGWLAISAAFLALYCLSEVFADQPVWRMVLQVIGAIFWAGLAVGAGLRFYAYTQGVHLRSWK